MVLLWLNDFYCKNRQRKSWKILLGNFSFSLLPCPAVPHPLTSPWSSAGTGLIFSRHVGVKLVGAMLSAMIQLSTSQWNFPNINFEFLPMWSNFNLHDMRLGHQNTKTKENPFLTRNLLPFPMGLIDQLTCTDWHARNTSHKKPFQDTVLYKQKRDTGK